MWYASDDPMPSITSTPKVLSHLMRDHRTHHGRHVDQDRRSIVGDQFEHQPGRAAFGERDSRASGPERKERHQIPRVTEEQLRHGQNPVFGTDREYSLGIPLEALKWTARGVHTSLGRAGAAGGELPDSDVVEIGRRGFELTRGGADQRAEVVFAGQQFRRGNPGDEQVRRPGLAQCRQRDGVGHYQRGLGIAQIVGVVLGLQEGVHLRCHRADLLHGVPGRHEIESVTHREQHQLSTSDTQLA
jgi:hypothetical protein